jgi:5-methylcytosine-specific restriction endonuclease McrA|tara:strand:- start:3180 stop:3692 length:513 start_codon:yes stop_codon:yes gene_type:complete
LTGADYKKTLVLDSSYIPRSIVSSTRAFVIVYKGSAEVVENHPECFKLVNEELKINKPSIIRIPRYIKTGIHKIPLNKQNILKRDNYSCVYCGDNYRRDLTIDHVIPQSKGGKNTWDNLVTACFKCNNKKGSLDLEEFGVDIKKPIRPHYLMLMKSLNYIYDSWKTYLSI